MTGAEHFIQIDLLTALHVVLLGFVGGVLSGFIGTGGAFFMTPGMMNLGVSGIVAVGSNITHKFGKSMMGARQHQKMGHVDRKLGIYMLLTALIGVRLAVWVNESLFDIGRQSSSGAIDSTIGDLYISALFVVILLVVGVFMLRDTLGSNRTSDRPSTRLSDRITRIRIPPMIMFTTADVRLSFWVVAAVGLLTGYLAGAIGVGGFVGVPAMIYAFGIPTAVAAGTELFLAVFMGAFGAVNYAFAGMVDLRLTFLLFLGSLSGIYIGAYGTRVVKERIIRLVTGLIIVICVASRAMTIPVYLGRLQIIRISNTLESVLELASKALLFTSGVVGVAVILFFVAKSYSRRREVQRLIKATRER